MFRSLRSRKGTTSSWTREVRSELRAKDSCTWPQLKTESQCEAPSPSGRGRREAPGEGLNCGKVRTLSRPSGDLSQRERGARSDVAATIKTPYQANRRTERSGKSPRRKHLVLDQHPGDCGRDDLRNRHERLCHAETHS